MIDREKLQEELSQLPLYFYEWIDMGDLEFSQRIRWICRHECPMYDRSWACPPAVGSVEDCQGKCRSYNSCLMISTITEVADISDITGTLATRADHEAVTNEVRELLRQQGIEPYVLSTEACAHCQRCAWLDGQPCRYPERMHPCVESHGINIIPVLDRYGLTFQYGENVVTWFSLLFCNE